MAIQLGDRIELNNFEELDPGELTVLKKMIGNHANKFHEFSKLHLHLKAVHKKEKSQKYQINGQLEIDNKHLESESTNFNLFFAINEVLDRLKEQLK
jgi:ribosome-associated translation inhibitor RaiA